MEASISVINMSFSQKTNFPLPTFQLNTNGQKVFLKRQQKQKKNSIKTRDWNQLKRSEALSEHYLKTLLRGPSRMRREKDRFSKR
jgi:hypothetical protein